MEPQYLNFGGAKAREKALGFWNATQGAFNAIKYAHECGLDPTPFIAAGMRAHEYEKYLWDLVKTRVAQEAVQSSLEPDES